MLFVLEGDGRMKDNLLKAENLTKIFRMGSIFSRTKLIAVDKVNFEINQAEIFTLAGESGSGKTTVSRMILGLLEASEGKIYYKGKDITDIESRRKKMEFMKDVQAIFQNPFETFNPLRKVENYLYETAENFEVAREKEMDEVVKESLNTVGLKLEDVKGKYPGEFSGGQLQRISVARALITKPSLLVADEPVSMVDASLRMSIVNLFKELKEKYGVSVLYITHDLATAYYVSDRIAIMFRGNIVEMGDVEKVLMDPKHPYTMMLKESIPEPDPKKKWNKRVELGLMEKEEYLMSGCKFAERCPHVMGICRENEVPEFNLNDRIVKCFLYMRRAI